MTAETSTYTYEGGEQETVTLSRGSGTPHGHSLLRIIYSDGETADCYVNTAWLRDRLNDLGEPCRLTPDAITDQFVDYVHEDYFWSTSDRVRLEKPALKHALLDAAKRLAEAPEMSEAKHAEARAYNRVMRETTLEMQRLQFEIDRLNHELLKLDNRRKREVHSASERGRVYADLIASIRSQSPSDAEVEAAANVLAESEDTGSVETARAALSAARAARRDEEKR